MDKNKEKVEKRTKFISRCSNINLRAVQDESDKMKFEGYAIVFDQATVLWVSRDGTEYKEIISKNALANADMNDVPLRYNHSRDWVLARTRKKVGEGSLLLSIDDYGLKVSGEFVNNGYSRDVFAMLVAQVVDQMSFAFTIRDKGESYDPLTHTSTILDIDKLFDVSIVDEPAYPQTSISASRCAEDAEMEIKAKLEAEALEKEKAEAAKKAQEELENTRKAKLEKLETKLKVISLLEKIK